MGVQRHEVRLFGHRGSSARLPENTIAAFRQALADGANAIELDVHCTCDGHFVVSHDDSGARMAGVAERISSTTLDRVKRWDVSTGFVGGPGDLLPVGRCHTVPTLSEVLHELPGVPLSIDLKPNNPELVEPLLGLIAAHDAEDRITVASFHDHMVMRARRLGYRGRTALTRSEVLSLLLLPFAVARRLVRGQAAQIPIRSGLLRLDRSRFLARCQRLGIRIDYWVVNDEQEAAQLLRRGATGLMSDDPGRLYPTVQEYSRPSHT